MQAKSANIFDILETRDYDEFKPLDGNRQISKAHVNRLKAAIQENNLLHEFPILVNERYEVIDGQHRLEAARQLGVPIYFRVVEGADIRHTAYSNNVVKKWNTEQYLRARVKCESPNKEMFEELSLLADEYRVKMNVMIAILSDRCPRGFAHGIITDSDFKLNYDKQELDRTMERIGWMIDMINEYCGGKRTISRESQFFWLAAARFFRSEPVDWERFEVNFIRLCHLVRPISSVTGYYDILSKIYHSKMAKTEVTNRSEPTLLDILNK